MLKRIRGKVKVQARYIFISMSDTRYETRDDDYLLIIIGTKLNTSSFVLAMLNVANERQQQKTTLYDFQAMKCSAKRLFNAN